MRVILDTNILVSACWKEGGNEDRVIGLALSGAVTSCVTAEILAEYAEVLARPKLAKVRSRADELLQALLSQALTVTAAAKLAVCTDPDDNRFLECAEAAGAEYLITGNLRHYPGNRGNTRVLNARTFLDTVGL